MDKKEAFEELGLTEHQLRFTSSVNLETRLSANDVMEQLQSSLHRLVRIVSYSLFFQSLQRRRTLNIPV